MSKAERYIVGTSGYSFTDWVGTFYPAGTRRSEMLEQYVKHFKTVELNFTYYRMPTAAMLERMAAKLPDDFALWVKANQRTTHQQDRSAAEPFLAALDPMTASGKLAGVLLQFPQSFHRTVDNRNYLARTADDFASVPLAVEFRHCSWDEPATFAGLRQRGLTVVIPDVPELPGLFRPRSVTATSPTGYLRLHSRTARKWYAGGAERYDYDYSTHELKAILKDWAAVENEVEKVYTFFNNCHRGQAAHNAESFLRLLDHV